MERLWKFFYWQHYKKGGFMMNRKWMVVVLMAGVISILSAQVVFAQPSEKRKMKAEKKEELKKEHFEKMFKDLNLTAEQKEKMKAQKKAHMEKAQALKEQIRAQKDAMKQELEKNEWDMNKVNQIHEQIKSLLLQQEDNRLAGLLELKSLLTLEQFVQFHKNMKECKGEFFKEGHRSQEKQGHGRKEKFSGQVSPMEE